MMQKKIENKIDHWNETSIGEDIIAILALEARKSILEKPTRFIKEFAESIGYENKSELVAYKVLKYLYPENHSYWQVWDKIYMDRINNSPHIKALKNIV